MHVIIITCLARYHSCDIAVRAAYSSSCINARLMVQCCHLAICQHAVMPGADALLGRAVPCQAVLSSANSKVDCCNSGMRYAASEANSCDAEQAIYDKGSDSFVINTPDDTASKFWIGGAAQHGKVMPSSNLMPCFSCLEHKYN